MTDKREFSTLRNPGQTLPLKIVVCCIFVPLLTMVILLANNAITHGATTASNSAASITINTIQIGLDATTLSAVVASQIGSQQSNITDVHVVPTANDGLALNMNLHIDSNGLQRVIPIQINCIFNPGGKLGLQLHVQQVMRDGIDAGIPAATALQGALDQVLANAPALPSDMQAKLNSVKLSVHTSATLQCGQGTELLMLSIHVRPISLPSLPISGTAVQSNTLSLCIKGPIDVNKLTKLDIKKIVGKMP